MTRALCKDNVALNVFKAILKMTHIVLLRLRFDKKLLSITVDVDVGFLEY